jgi:hypothetical protein
LEERKKVCKFAGKEKYKGNECYKKYHILFVYASLLGITEESE